MRRRGGGTERGPGTSEGVATELAVMSRHLELGSLEPTSTAGRAAPRLAPRRVPWPLPDSPRRLPAIAPPPGGRGPRDRRPAVDALGRWLRDPSSAAVASRQPGPAAGLMSPQRGDKLRTRQVLIRGVLLPYWLVFIPSYQRLAQGYHTAFRPCQGDWRGSTGPRFPTLDHSGRAEAIEKSELDRQSSGARRHRRQWPELRPQLPRPQLLPTPLPTVLLSS